ncbi:EamA family transporter [Candidatus Woesearchaeota archaeon B3_Woes]|nr:MAG: EamA family transporter [Candidatus Woesearchaeota archaeon B3_Woes]
MIKKTNKWWPALLIIIAAMMWGIDGSVLRPALYSLQAKVVVFTEHAIAFTIMLILIIITLITNKKSSWLQKDIKSIKKLSFKRWLSVGWVAFFGGMIGTIAITKALFYVGFVPLSVPILLQKLQPIFAILLARIVLKEKPKKKFYFWAFLALIGSYFVTFGLNKPFISFENKTLMAAILGLIAAFSWGSSTVFGKNILKSLSFRAATFLRFGVTSILVFLLLILTSSLSGLSNIQPTHIMILIIIALTTGGLAIFIYYKGLQKVKASSATIYELAFPITVLILDYLLHGKILSIHQFIGATLIIISFIKITK